MDTDGERAGLRVLLAANVRRLRKARNWSQEVLGEAANLHRTQIGVIERAEKDVRVSTIEKLGAALGVTARDLLQD